MSYRMPRAWREGYEAGLSGQPKACPYWGQLRGEWLEGYSRGSTESRAS